MSAVSGELHNDPESNLVQELIQRQQKKKTFCVSRTKEKAKKRRSGRTKAFHDKLPLIYFAHLTRKRDYGPVELVGGTTVL